MPLIQLKWRPNWSNFAKMPGKNADIVEVLTQARNPDRGHCVVGSLTGAVAGPKGMAPCHPFGTFKVVREQGKNVVRQFGPYLPWALEI